MSYRALGMLPFVATALSAIVLSLVPADVRPMALHIVAEIAKTLSLVGLTAAALAFGKGDYLRRGWGLIAGCYSCLLARDVWIAVLPGDAGEIGRGLLVIVANVFVVAGTWTLARAWQVAGLAEMETSAVRNTVIGLAVTASLVFAGPALWVDLQYTVHGHGSYYWMVASDFGDLLALPVLAPVAMTALAVKGGTLRWPWGLLAASLGAWLLYDAVLTVPEVLRIKDEGGFRLAADCCRIFATTSAFAAGMAQRRSIHELGGAG